MLTFTYSIGPDVRIRFSVKPDEQIRSALKSHGFRWSPANGHWWRRRVDGAADFLAMLERKIGPKKPDGACWHCKSPEGYFRPQGPATPVYCDRCFEMLAHFHSLPLAEQDRFRSLAQTTELSAPELAWTNRPTAPEHTCAGMHDVSCDACHEQRCRTDRFDLEYEDRCRDACGL